MSLDGPSAHPTHGVRSDGRRSAHLSKIAWTVRSSARVPSAASVSGAATLPLLGSAIRADKLQALDYSTAAMPHALRSAHAQATL